MVKKIVSKTVLAAAKKKLVSLSKNWTAGVTMGRAWDMTGNEIGGKDYTACHAWVSNMYTAHCGRGFGTHNFASTYKEDAVNFLTLSCHSKKRSETVCSAEAHEAIILWMASDDCPLSQYILNRDDTDSLLNGGVIILCGPDGASLAETMWMCKVLRYGVEGSKALEVWKALFDAGVAPVLALLVATYVRSVSSSSFGYSGPDGHSTVFGGGLRQEGLGNIADLLRPKSRPFCNDTSGVFFSDRPAEGKSVINVSGKIRGFCKPTKKSDGWGGTVASNGSAKEDFIANVLAWQAELDPSFTRNSSETLDLEMNNAATD